MDTASQSRPLSQALGLPGVRMVRHEGLSTTVDNVSFFGISMCLVESFSTDCRVAGTRIVNTPSVGDFAIIAPGHRTQVTVKGQCHAVQFWFPIDDAARLVEEEIEIDGARLEFKPSFDNHNSELLALMMRTVAAEPEARDTYTRQLVLHLCCRYSNLRERPRIDCQRQGGLAPIRLRRVIDYVEANLARAISIDELASAAALSPFHFAREFKRVLGQAPHSYVVERRIAHATKLLSGNGFDVEEVARRSGFAHGSHLSRHLKSRYGVSAAELRALTRA